MAEDDRAKLRWKPPWSPHTLSVAAEDDPQKQTGGPRVITNSNFDDFVKWDPKTGWSPKAVFEDPEFMSTATAGAITNSTGVIPLDGDRSSFAIIDKGKFSGHVVAEADLPADAAEFGLAETMALAVSGLKSQRSKVNQEIEAAKDRRARWFNVTVRFSTLGAAAILGGIALGFAGFVESGIATSLCGGILQLVWVPFHKKDGKLAAETDRNLGHARDYAKQISRIGLIFAIKDDENRDKVIADLIKAEIDAAPDVGEDSDE